MRVQIGAMVIQDPFARKHWKIRFFHISRVRSLLYLSNKILCNMNRSELCLYSEKKSEIKLACPLKSMPGLQKAGDIKTWGAKSACLVNSLVAFNGECILPLLQIHILFSRFSDPITYLYYACAWPAMMWWVFAIHVQNSLIVFAWHSVRTHTHIHTLAPCSLQNTCWT